MIWGCNGLWKHNLRYKLPLTVSITTTKTSRTTYTERKIFSVLKVINFSCILSALSCFDKSVSWLIAMGWCTSLSAAVQDRSKMCDMLLFFVLCAYQSSLFVFFYFPTASVWRYTIAPKSSYFHLRSFIICAPVRCCEFPFCFWKVLKMPKNSKYVLQNLRSEKNKMEWESLKM